MKTIYVHYKNNLQYQVIDHCKLQVNSEWVDAYVYVQFPQIPGTYNQKYVRSVKEFLTKFTLVEETNSITDGCSFLEYIRSYQLQNLIGKYKLWK